MKKNNLGRLSREEYDEISPLPRLGRMTDEEYEKLNVYKVCPRCKKTINPKKYGSCSEDIEICPFCGRMWEKQGNKRVTL